MKKIKSLLLVAVLSFALFTANVFAKDKVKVYIFEAGGCPYCEAEIEYLKKLDSYDEKFEIIEKELYVDHVDWEEGKDYDLGVKVAEAFQKKGYSDASYQGTPFVVISNLYAAASYSESLEDVINEAYEAGDQDVVGCFADDEDDCADKIKENENKTTTTSQDETQPQVAQEEEKSDSNSATAAIVLVFIVLVIIGLLFIARGKLNIQETKTTKKESKKEEPKKVETKKVETKKSTPKKTTAKKTTAKKTTTKKTTAKKTSKK